MWVKKKKPKQQPLQHSFIKHLSDTYSAWGSKSALRLIPNRRNWLEVCMRSDAGTWVLSCGVAFPRVKSTPPNQSEDLETGSLCYNTEPVLTISFLLHKQRKWPGWHLRCFRSLSVSQVFYCWRSHFRGCPGGDNHQETEKKSTVFFNILETNLNSA